MASLHRTISRNIARQHMIALGVKHLHRKGYAVDPSKEIKASKAFKRTLTSLFALNWRAFLPSAGRNGRSREPHKPLFTRKRAKEA